MKVQEMRDKTKFETPIVTEDGEGIVLFHNEPISIEEIIAISSFTKKELKLFAKMQGFKEEVAE